MSRERCLTPFPPPSPHAVLLTTHRIATHTYAAQIGFPYSEAAYGSRALLAARGIDPEAVIYESEDGGEQIDVLVPFFQCGSLVYMDREYTAAGFAFEGVEAASITLRVHRVPFAIRPPPLDESMLCSALSLTAGLSPPPGTAFPAFPTLVVADSARAAAAAARMAQGSRFVVGRSEHQVTEFVTPRSRKNLRGRRWEPTLILCLPPRREDDIARVSIADGAAGAASGGVAAAARAGQGPSGLSLILKDYAEPHDPGTLFCMTAQESAAGADVEDGDLSSDEG
jgi:hypothetical protein